MRLIAVAIFLLSSWHMAPTGPVRASGYAAGMLEFRSVRLRVSLHGSPFSRQQFKTLGTSLKDHIEGPFRGSPNLGKAGADDNLRELCLAGLCAETFSDLLIKRSGNADHR